MIDEVSVARQPLSAQRLIEETFAAFSLSCSHLLKFNTWNVERKYLK